VFELVHLAAAYVIGSAAALWLFRKWSQERIVTATLDSLIEQGYLMSYLDDDGQVQLSKWGDVDVIDNMSNEEIESILEELIREDAANKEEEASKHEEDDTP